jgi:uncharacterized RDD family membrane protein YckC
VPSSNNFSPGTPEGGRRDSAPVEIILASWADRFVAWLIDFIIVSIGLAILFALISFPFWFMHYGNDMIVDYRNIRPIHYLLSSLVFFAYWTYFESTSRQSVGKRLLNIKTTDLSGKRVDIKSAAIESFGKSFLLPIDVILGWIFTNNKRQRIFNKISNTLVIKLTPGEVPTPENIRYTKD